MQLITKAQYEQLLKNGSDNSPDRDYPPVIKLFMTGTACTWLISELDPENPDIGFGLCDLGMGFPELGYVSIGEIFAAQCPPTGQFLCRDTAFTGEHPLSVYARAARLAGEIVDVKAIAKRPEPKPQP